jgi:hypothetical protein
MPMRVAREVSASRHGSVLLGPVEGDGLATADPHDAVADPPFRQQFKT